MTVYSMNDLSDLANIWLSRYLVVMDFGVNTSGSETIQTDDNFNDDAFMSLTL